MGMKNIPLRDKELVKQRLAAGASTREAIKGTSIASQDTAHRISKDESDSIVRLRAKYLKLIKKFGAKDIDRARLWAEMTKATKTISAQVLIKEDGGVAKKEDEGMIEVPDWANRREALRYIDFLGGITQPKEFEKEVSVNVLNIVEADRNKYK